MWKSMKKVKKSKSQEKSEKRAATFFRSVEEKLRSLLDERPDEFLWLQRARERAPLDQQRGHSQRHL